MERDREPVNYNAGASAALRWWVQNRRVITGFRHHLQPEVFGWWRALGLLENVSLDPVHLLFRIRTLLVDSAGIYSRVSPFL